ncbi:hypothetical protein F442_15128 [Phytophthora nicotianae P10297]|uniref:Uncharacterized protein n=3 Tax=Phytophthora nicotianae TaxID=4792 RepID=W2P8M4_PHYN3|nr:hypothetical protein PPTG_24995 [Phytophthora nicotianae INRA-310]ETM97352.1 hypothetical protein PPTG_24995 [Phytophthora nicotianae INRA-310]ETO67831.1 hypothetical protein F444_15283 [Phytophthora nicotianae P1976]ETP37028.1 hypothetical protein F442_15128 [Phytophthora nicotianae P10297]
MKRESDTQNDTKGTNQKLSISSIFLAISETSN